MKITLLLVLATITLAHNASSARILAMVGIPSYSHQMFHQPLWRELAERGHDMVVITTHPTGKSLPNFKEISIAESRRVWDKIVHFLMQGFILDFFKMNELIHELVEVSISQPQMQELIQNKTEHFDLVILEHNFGPYFAFKHRFKCPLIGVTSMDAMPVGHAIMGNPIHRVLYPVAILPFQENLTFFQRVAALSVGVMFDFFTSHMFVTFDDMAKRYFGDDVPNLHALVEETDMLFVNANPLFTPVRPHTPSTISIAGGIHIRPEKPLPQDLKTFLDSAQNGAVYFSLGGNVKSSELPNEMLQTILDTFSQIPYKVLFKFEDDQLEGIPPNVKIIKWAPQQDILRHKNVKVFVSQGGLQSMEEALYTHIPVIVMPFFGDQLIHADKMKAKEMGLVVDRYNLNVEEFKAAIIEVITNPKYKNNIKELAMRIQDEPMKPLEKAVWWTEYVLRHKGAKHLKGPKISFYQYFYFDVFAFLGVAFVLFIGLIYITTKLLIKGFRCVYSKFFKKANSETPEKVKKT